MDTAHFLALLREVMGLRVRLSPDGEGVAVGPAHRVDDDTLAAVEAHRHSLLCLLRAEAGLPPPPEPPPAPAPPPVQGELFGPAAGGTHHDEGR